MRQLQETGIEVRGFSPTIDATAVLTAEIQDQPSYQDNTVEHLVLAGTCQESAMDDCEAGMISALVRWGGWQTEAVGARLLWSGTRPKLQY